jgi:sugar phosphate isomerase/epimerase
MVHKLTIGDIWFYNSMGSYSFETKCRIAQELGFDGMYFAIMSEDAWGLLPDLARMQADYGVAAAGVYIAVDSPDDETSVQNVIRLLESLEGASEISLAITNTPGSSGVSDPAGDDAAVAMLNRLLPIAERRGIDIVLYHHTYCWMERLDDAVRLCEKVQHPRLRAAFNGHHWYIVDGKKPDELIARAAPYLSAVNLNGSRRLPSDNGMPATIELIDEGELDNFYLLGLLHKVGYSGPVGLQGFSIGGDAYPKLKRSYEAFRDMERRVEAHPEWIDLPNSAMPRATGA